MGSYSARHWIYLLKSINSTQRFVDGGKHKDWKYVIWKWLMIENEGYVYSWGFGPILNFATLKIEFEFKRYNLNATKFDQ